ncbi:hypothetical protein IFT54_16635 [Sphingomonas sp. CFBP 13714]|uniref:hypothetical protein n=1 Tax=Sphingomonas sp. CFBP 13714 TaxID=2775308 RepID=UPI001786EDA1|nr:hypothetical protein [Sphingomonas sp. CFBP 13714]MBD8701445.1 hypothetical protein [Sphingomonas sp. CFBP 13714]
MSQPRDWKGAKDPAGLFLLLWRYVSKMSRERLSGEVELPLMLAPAVRGALAKDDPTEAVGSLCDSLEVHWDPGTQFMARRLRASIALAAMRGIDDALLAIHPRSIVSGMGSSTLPSWLNDVRELRTVGGAYAANDELMLIARGPFARSPKLALEEATFSLVDQFAAVKVIDRTSFKEDGRTINVTVKVIDQSTDCGVGNRHDRAASEVVTFVPLAENGSDLVPVVTPDGKVTFLDVVKGVGYEPSDILLKAVQERPDSDIVVAPELTIDEADIEKIAAGLSAMSGERPRMLVSGSGLSQSSIVSSDGESGYPYNEATIINGHGATLWRHRKVSAYGMLKSTSDNLDICGGSTPPQLMERITWSDSITVADVDGLGRCVVLICQDIMMSLVGQLLQEFRPDWVIVPILDSGTSIGRWPSKRAEDLSGMSEARFIVVSSLTMKHWQIKKYSGDEMGVAVGPKYTNRGDPGEPTGVMAQVTPESAHRRHGSIRWRSRTGWVQK